VRCFPFAFPFALVQVGYLSFLKIGPKLLKFIPGKKVRDLRNWLTVYSYWNQVHPQAAWDSFPSPI